MQPKQSLFFCFGCRWRGQKIDIQSRAHYLVDRAAIEIEYDIPGVNCVSCIKCDFKYHRLVSFNENEFAGGLKVCRDKIHLVEVVLSEYPTTISEEGIDKIASVNFCFPQKNVQLREQVQVNAVLGETWWPRVRLCDSIKYEVAVTVYHRQKIGWILPSEKEAQFAFTA